MEFNDRIKKNIIKTLIYSDIFEYPLRKEEIIQWFNQKSSPALSSYLDKVNGVVFQRNNLFFLEKRAHLVDIRKKREQQAQYKFNKAREATKLLARIPTVEFIGVSGSLAMGNTDTTDDIDLIIITKRNSLWLTRLICVLMLEILRIRRSPKAKNVKDKICLNMFIDEKNLKIPKSEQNFYTSHEVCQMRVLFDRNKMYERFIEQNKWVRKYLPNALKMGKGEEERVKQKPRILFPIPFPLYPIEWLAKFIQLTYMKLRGRLSKAVIEDGRLLFYPKNYHKEVLNKYNKRLADYDLSI